MSIEGDPRGERDDALRDVVGPLAFRTLSEGF